MVDAVILSKCQIIENWLARIAEEYENKHENLFNDIRRQDSIVLNLERACQAAIDLALRMIRLKKLGVPNESKEAFQILQKNNLIELELSESLQKMVGFRNLAVHDYQTISLEIVESILLHKLQDFRSFISICLQADLKP